MLNVTVVSFGLSFCFNTHVLNAFILSFFSPPPGAGAGGRAAPDSHGPAYLHHLGSCSDIHGALPAADPKQQLLQQV